MITPKNYHQQEFINSLRAISEASKICSTNYRILGSANIVAHTGRLHRQLEDIDVLLDIKDRICFFERLENMGYSITKKRFLIFTWNEALKKHALKITFFLTGTFTADYFSYRTGVLELRISSSYLQEMLYTFKGIPFVGIPIASVMDGIYRTALSRKRGIDKYILEQETKTFDKKVKGHWEIRFFRLKIPYLYEIFSFLANLYGFLIERSNLK